MFAAGAVAVKAYVSTHSRLKAAGLSQFAIQIGQNVSTHSRLKAAGTQPQSKRLGLYRFNTQPPEGGWYRRRCLSDTSASFNTQPPEGGWVFTPSFCAVFLSFNTQPPEGGWLLMMLANVLASAVSTHSRLKAAGKADSKTWIGMGVSTHSRLKAAGSLAPLPAPQSLRFNTQPPEGGWVYEREVMKTATKVSTHSRLKAAGFRHRLPVQPKLRFNTQPPEGGWPTA